MQRKIRYIGTRLIASSAVMIAILVSTLAVVTIMMQRNDLMNHVRKHSNQLSEISQRSLYYSMLRYDRANIEKTISEIGKDERIEMVRIFNKSGEVIYASDPQDVGLVVSTEEVGCVQCHTSDTPLVELTAADRTREFNDGTRNLFEVVTPIYNEPACSTDPCHQHPAGQNVLGVLYMTVSLAEVEENMARSALLIIGFTIAIIVVLSVFLAFYVRCFIRRPIMALTHGVRRVAAGELDHQIRVESNNEIGELALAFNQMTIDLKKAQQEIEQWGHSLADRVAERTAELEQTQAELLQSQKLVSMGKLAASVAHEINNPLMGILTFTRTFQGWIKEGAFPPQKFEEFDQDLEIMGKETMRISKIVRNLLAFARRSKLEKHDEDINGLLRSSLELLNHRLSLAEIDIYLHLSPDLPKLFIDAGQVQQAFMNLLLNASEAMGDGGILTISSGLTADGNRVSVKIEDTGTGISKAVMGRLFDPFFTTKEVGQGTGLGLPVAYGIVRKHGGSINVKSEVGTGTEFEVVLPVTRVEGPDDDDSEEL